MKFVNTHAHSVTLADDGREVEPHGECEMTPEQYQNPEQWRTLGESFVGATVAAQKVVDESKTDPDKYDNQDETTVASDDTEGGQT